MARDRVDEIMKQYDEEVSALRLFADRLRMLIEEILLANGIIAHSINCRVKDRDSLEKKVVRPDKSYERLDDITDVVGVRVITYFASDVDAVARIIEQEFDVDRKNSVDKRSLLDPDRFGYLSLHFVLKLSPERRVLAEYKRLPNVQAEVQVRSILQHAWAEIEHDLGYKTRLAVPTQTRRRFSRLAGLLELADEEFTAIRKDLNAYEKEVPERIEHAPADVEVDKISLKVFIEANTIIKALDGRVMAAIGVNQSKARPDTTLELDVKRLARVGIHTIQQLERALDEYGEKIVGFAEHWVVKTHPWVYNGVSMLYLVYVRLCQTTDASEIENLLNSWGMGKPGERAEVARRLVDIYKQISG